MKKLFFSLLAMMVTIGASAATEITSGTSYYIQNVESGLYMGGANNWGTRGSVSVDGEMFTATLVSDGVYTLKDVAITSGYLGSNIYTDNGTAQNWTITAVTGEDGVFTISDGTNYLVQSTEAGGIIGYVISTTTEITSAAKWYFLTKDEAIAKLDAATNDAPVDATFLIGDANFSRNHTNTAWTQTKGSFNLAGGATDNLCAEAWRNSFDLNQTFTVPNGVYELTAQAALTDYNGNYDGSNYAVVYANAESTPFLAMEESDRGTNMTTLSNSFTSGKYVIDPIKVTVTDGTLKIGVRSDYTTTWCIWDNFQLKYYNVDLTALKEALATNLAAAEDIDQTAAMSTSYLTALQTAISNAESVEETADALTAAATALATATANATTSIALYAEIAAKEATLDDAGKAAFEASTTGAAYVAKTLENGTNYSADYIAAVKAQTSAGADMTGAIVNNSFEMGNLTSWTSTDGGNVASNNNAGALKVGTYFVERWQSSGNGGLSDGSLLQTLTSMPAGVYTLTANCQNIEQQNSGAAGTGYFLTLGDQQTEVGANATYSVTCQLAEAGDLTLGMTLASCSGNWVSCDEFILTYVGSDFPEVTLVTDPMNAEVSAAQTAASDAFTAEKTVANYNALVAAVKAAQASADVYATIKDAIDAAAATVATFDEAGQTAYPSTATTAYTNGTYTTLAEANVDLTAALATAAKAQTTDGSDMTLGVTGYSCTNGLAYDGWGWAAARQVPEGWEVYDADDTLIDFGTTLHVNYWSVEGDTDGSSMTAPFAEVWGYTPDQNIKVQNTITDLHAGTYTVTAMIRVRDLADGATAPAGLTFYANDTEVTPTYTAGTDCYYATVKAVVTLDDAGNIDFGFAYDKDNVNFTWLSFKDVTLKLTNTWTKTGRIRPVSTWSGYVYSADGATVTVQGTYGSNTIKVTDTGGYDDYITLTCDENDAITAFNFNGTDVDVTSYGGGYFDLGDVYYAYFYPTYSYANADPDNGYVTLSGWFYESSNTSWGNVDIEWYDGVNDFETASLNIKGTAQYGTFVAPFTTALPATYNSTNWDYESTITAYTVDAVDETGLLTLTELTSASGYALYVIPANTPVVVYTSGTDDLSYTVQGPKESSDNLTTGLLTGVLEATTAPEGTYVLQVQDSKVGFYQTDGTKTVPANRCYLTAPADTDIKAFTFGNTDAIQAIEALTSGNAKIYDLNGRQLSKLQKGINIVNGKKIMVK